MLIYPFRVTSNRIRNRPADEVRGQLRYGSEASWERTHPIARDVAGVDVTMVLGVDLEDAVIIGLDAALWDPLPMGISFNAKIGEIEQAQAQSWHVWEKVNKAGSRRAAPRSPTSLETVVAFQPPRMVDYARLERRASSLRLDPALRFAAAEAMRSGDSLEAGPRRHVLEEQFALSSEQILDIIGGRNRLSVAVRGGVAEHHLESRLKRDPQVCVVKRLDIDAMHDFDVELYSGDKFRVECKNASPRRNAAGQFKVEVQKPRSSKNDPTSRFYSVDSFDVVAACVFSATGSWDFFFGRTFDMQRHTVFPDRLAPVQTIGDVWSTELAALGPSVARPDAADPTPGRIDLAFPTTPVSVDGEAAIADRTAQADDPEPDELELDLG